jgi:hypothetical protein
MGGIDLPLTHKRTLEPTILFVVLHVGIAYVPNVNHRPETLFLCCCTRDADRYNTLFTVVDSAAERCGMNLIQITVVRLSGRGPGGPTILHVSFSR